MINYVHCEQLWRGKDWYKLVIPTAKMHRDFQGWYDHDKTGQTSGFCIFLYIFRGLKLVQLNLIGL